MVSDKTIKLLNDQVALEEESSQAYLAMATWAQTNGFLGTAKFMFKQAEEERGHMHKIIRFLLDINGNVVVPGLSAPKGNFRDIEEVFNDALKHEQKVTSSIHNIFSVARDNSEYQVTSFLKWFVDEQVEEEATVNQILDIIRLAGKVSIYLADKEIGNLKSDS